MFYCLLIIFLDSTSGLDTKIGVVRQSGSFDHGIGTTERLDTGLTTIADSKWHHYAITLKNSGTNLLSSLYSIIGVSYN